MTDEQYYERNKSRSGYPRGYWLARGQKFEMPNEHNLPVMINDRADEAFVKGVDWLQDNTGMNTEWLTLPYALTQRWTDKKVDQIQAALKDAYDNSKPMTLYDAYKTVKNEVSNFVNNVTDSVYIPTSNSAAGVADGTTESSSPFDSYLSYLNRLEEINNANNAFNVEQAQKQMDFQAQQNKIFMDFNALEAQKARDWQTEMSNTAYQRAAADMKAAGLNPVLAASGGNGASVGSGSAAQASGAASGSKASADNLFGSAMLSMMNSALNIAEKTASSAVSANAVAARSTAGSSIMDVVKNVSSVLSVVSKLRSIFR